MRPPRRHLPQEENTDSWLMSYADMITLLMCFFIIFVSVSEPKRDKFSEITEGLANKFGSVSMATPFAGAYGTLQSIVESQQLFRDVAIARTDRGIEMEIAGGAFFLKHSAEFNPEKLAVLEDMVESLQTLDYLDYRILIESHTSDLPTQHPVYRANWDLSAARSAALARLLVEKGLPANRIAAAAFADTRPKVPNFDLQNNPIPENRAINERMVIKLERVL